VAPAHRFAELPSYLTRLAAGPQRFQPPGSRLRGPRDQQEADIVRVYLPPDANCLLWVTDHCLRTYNRINVIVAGKQPAPQWLTLDEAVKHCDVGIGIWDWASNDPDGSEPDVVMACAGDVPTLETIAAVELLRKHLPELKVRVVNVVDLMTLQPKHEHPHGITDAEFDELFTPDRPVIFAYHGYPYLIHRLTYTAICGKDA
jgi:xylulose-5-phosphate/fructose-6-phosphate phosphoketolase